MTDAYDNLVKVKAAYLLLLSLPVASASRQRLQRALAELREELAHLTGLSDEVVQTICEEHAAKAQP